MPVEIRELIIRAVVASGDRSSESSPSVQMSDEDREALIRECVKQVLRILKKEQER